MTGSIIVIMVETRLDIAYTILVVSCFVKNPSHLHSKVLKTTFYYLKATKDIGNIYGEEQRGNLTIREYFDSIGLITTLLRNQHWYLSLFSMMDLLVSTQNANQLWLYHQ